MLREDDGDFPYLPTLLSYQKLVNTVTLDGKESSFNHLISFLVEMTMVRKIHLKLLFSLLVVFTQLHHLNVFLWATKVLILLQYFLGLLIRILDKLSIEVMGPLLLWNVVKGHTLTMGKDQKARKDLDVFIYLDMALVEFLVKN